MNAGKVTFLRLYSLHRLIVSIVRMIDCEWVEYVGLQHQNPGN